MESSLETELPRAEGMYPSTMWTEVGLAGRFDDERSLAALTSLLEKYYRPLQKHLQVKFQVEPDTAAEWLHGFYLQKIRLGNLLLVASRNKGRFRTFVLSALDRFVISEKRRNNAQKRLPRSLISIEDLPPGSDPSVFDDDHESSAEWGKEVVSKTLAKMKAECAAKGESRRWELFKSRLLEPVLNRSKPPPYETLQAQYGFESPAEASNCVITARRQFARLLREVIAEYVGEEEVESEVRDLQRSLAR
jgi:hypothetical protein